MKLNPCSRSQCLSTSVSGIFPLERALAIDVTPGSLLRFSPSLPRASYSSTPFCTLSVSVPFSFVIIEPKERSEKAEISFHGSSVPECFRCENTSMNSLLFPILFFRHISSLFRVFTLPSDSPSFFLYLFLPFSNKPLYLRIHPYFSCSPPLYMDVYTVQGWRRSDDGGWWARASFISLGAALSNAASRVRVSSRLC